MMLEKRFKLPVLKAGGMDVIDHLKEGLIEPDVLVNIRRVRGGGESVSLVDGPEDVRADRCDGDADGGGGIARGGGACAGCWRRRSQRGDARGAERGDRGGETFCSGRGAGITGTSSLSA